MLSENARDWIPVAVSAAALWAIVAVILLIADRRPSAAPAPIAGVI